MLNARMLIWVALLGMLAAAGWWLREQIQTVPQAQTAPSVTAPEYYMLGFTTYGMNPDGSPRYRLSADSMLHYAHDDHADLEQPRLTVFRPDTPPWEVDSERGQVFDQGERVHLLGAVVIERPAGADTRPLQVDTHDLRVWPEKDYAESDEPTVIRSGASQMEGIGMKAWFAEERLQLLSNVRGVHVPEKP